jgi:hypothetical protein
MFCCPQFNYKYHLPPVVCRGFIFLCCPIMYLYVLSSMVWCPLRFPHKTMNNAKKQRKKTWALLQTTWGKDESIIVLWGNRNGHHTMELRSFSGLSFLFLLQYFLTFIWIYIFVQYNYHSNKVWILLNISYIK